MRVTFGSGASPQLRTPARSFLPVSSMPQRRSCSCLRRFMRTHRSTSDWQLHRDVLSSREEASACAIANPGRKYAVYFAHGDTSEADDAIVAELLEPHKWQRRPACGHLQQVDSLLVFALLWCLWHAYPPGGSLHVFTVRIAEFVGRCELFGSCHAV